MKVLVIIEACLAGVGRHVIDLCRGMAGAGHDVHLAYSPSRTDALFLKGLAELRHLQVRQAPLPMRRNPHPGDLATAMAVRRYIKANGPFDVIHGQSSKGGALSRLGGAGLPGVKVYTPHALFTMNPELKPLAKWAFATIERCLDRLTDGIIAVSEEEQNHAIEIGLSRRKLFLVPNGIAIGNMLAASRLRQDLNISGSELCIGCVARFVPQKALEQLLYAFALLLPSLPNARLIMVGNGPLETQLRTLAGQLGIGEHVRWPGPVDGAESMPAFDVFALPSRYESFPYVLLEAMACGIPVVMTQVGGAGTLIIDGENGAVVPVGRPELLAAALGKLLRDHELRLRMAGASRNRVRQYSIERMLERTLNVYGVLVGRAKANPGGKQR